MLFVRCPFCHKLVFRWFYAAHESKHTQRREDGQMEEHITNRPEERFAGPLDGVPCAYRHPACGAATRMPEEIIRSYLVDALLYNDQSFCCGCGDYVESDNLYWVETGQKVMDYMAGLRRDHLQRACNIILPERPAGVTVTPRAAASIVDMASKITSLPFALFLGVNREGFHVNYSVQIMELPRGSDRPVVNGAEVRQAQGIFVVVPSEQAAELDGVVIDFRQAEPAGFSISRLYPKGLTSPRE